jgi:hypothetical protein
VKGLLIQNQTGHGTTGKDKGRLDSQAQQEKGRGSGKRKRKLMRLDNGSEDGRDGAIVE